MPRPLSKQLKSKSKLPKKSRSSSPKVYKARKVTGGGAELEVEYIGADGNKSIAFNLREGEKIIADGNAMAYMDGSLKVETKMGGLGKAIGRALSGENMFLNNYTGTSSTRTQRIVLSVPYPGDIMSVRLNEGEVWKLSKGAFLAATDGVEVSGKLNLKGMLKLGSDDGVFLSKVTAKQDATVWVASYGHIEKHELPDSSYSMLVDNENFLTSPEGVSYSISKVGGFKSLIFGGEGLAMRFTGPAVLYTQTKGIQGLANALAPYIIKNYDE